MAARRCRNRRAPDRPPPRWRRWARRSPCTAHGRQSGTTRCTAPIAADRPPTPHARSGRHRPGRGWRSCRRRAGAACRRRTSAPPARARASPASRHRGQGAAARPRSAAGATGSSLPRIPPAARKPASRRRARRLTSKGIRQDARGQRAEPTRHGFRWFQSCASRFTFHAARVSALTSSHRQRGRNLHRDRRTPARVPAARASGHRGRRGPATRGVSRFRGPGRGA